MDFQIEWPEPMDEFGWAHQEAKGWLDVTVAWNGGTRVVEVYDPVRLAQSVNGEVARVGRFSSRSLMVVPSVTRENVQAAIAAIADEGFFERG